MVAWKMSILFNCFISVGNNFYFDVFVLWFLTVFFYSDVKVVNVKLLLGK